MKRRKKMNKKRLTLVSLVAILVLTPTLVALAYYVIEQTTSDTYLTAAPPEVVGQSFTTEGAGCITQIDIFIGPTAPVGTMEGRIYSGDGFGGTQIHSQFVTASGVPNDWEKIYPTSPVAVDANTQYTFGIKITTGAPEVGVSVAGDQYTGGDAYSGKPDWVNATATAGRDVAFKVHIGGCPVGGHTEPARPVALLWPWLAMAAIAVTGTVTLVALKRRAA